MYIEIATTPNTTQKETGFGGLIACESLQEAIQKAGHRVKLNVCQTEADLGAIVERNPDLVVLAVKYLEMECGEDLWLADYFQYHQVNFTGSQRRVLRFDSNKISAKKHLRKQGVATADFFTAEPGQFKSTDETPMRFPFFVKPSDAANGNGVDDLSFVEDFTAFQAKVSALHETYHLPVLVEQYLDGREFTVAIIEAPNGRLIVSAIEIVPPETGNGLRILGERVKREDSEELIPIDDGTLEQKVAELAISAFRKLGARDFGRIDIKSTKEGECFFLEANLVPGMTCGSSYFPRACEIANALSYESVVRLMLESALCRQTGQKIGVSGQPQPLALRIPTASWRLESEHGLLGETTTQGYVRQ